MRGCSSRGIALDWTALKEESLCAGSVGGTWRVAVRRACPGEERRRVVAFCSRTEVEAKQRVDSDFGGCARGLRVMPQVRVAAVQKLEELVHNFGENSGDTAADAKRARPHATSRSAGSPYLDRQNCK